MSLSINVLILLLDCLSDCRFPSSSEAEMWSAAIGRLCLQRDPRGQRSRLWQPEESWHRWPSRWLKWAGVAAGNRAHFKKSCQSSSAYGPMIDYCVLGWDSCLTINSSARLTSSSIVHSNLPERKKQDNGSRQIGGKLIGVCRFAATLRCTGCWYLTPCSFFFLNCFPL